MGPGQWLQDSSVGELGPQGCTLHSISSVFVFSKIPGVQRDSFRNLGDLKNAASAEVWLVSENNSLWR